jgi:hypothetical protein
MPLVCSSRPCMPAVTNSNYGEFAAVKKSTLRDISTPVVRIYPALIRDLFFRPDQADTSLEITNRYIDLTPDRLTIAVSDDL